MSQPHETTDAIARCLRGEQMGYAALYDAYAPGILRLCYSLVFNPQDAEDVAQEAFVYAFKNLHRFDASRASFKTWLYTIAISRCRNVYRRKHSLFTELTQLLAQTIPGPRSETPEAAHAQHTAESAVKDALAGLSPRLREAIVLRYGHGLTFREMAEIMGCPPKTAESRVRLAHDALRSMLEPVGPALLEEILTV